MGATPETTRSGNTIPNDSPNPGVFVMEKKVCFKCGEEKSVDGFRKHRNHCRKCCNEYDREYKKTKHGVIMSFFHGQLGRMRRKENRYIDYTFNELQEWCLSQSLFHILYNRWVESNYDEWMKPSVDRIDDYKWYSIDNIQLMTWAENNSKAHRDQINGINTKQCTPVLQYDLSVNFIKEYYSMSQASRETGINRSGIYNTCVGRANKSGGYIWKYKN